MLYELFTYLTTPCPQYVRHMDYLYEIIAMKSRYRHNRAAWESHLENTRQFVISAAQGCRNRSKAVILGAGLLLDVPLGELSSIFREVVLLDIVLLPEVLKSARKYDNIRIIQHDVTNVARRLHENILRGRHELPEALPAIPEIDEDTGLVVSLNILSQLWVMPRAYALNKLRNLDEDRLNDWCGKIVQSHFTFLTSLPFTICLIADHEFIQRDRQGTIVRRGSTISGFTLPPPHASWSWNIVPPSEDRQFLSKELNVGAWRTDNGNRLGAEQKEENSNVCSYPSRQMTT
jgi:hypothetical protein